MCTENGKGEMSKAALLWNMYAEVRKETIETQKMRNVAIELKITFTVASAGAIWKFYYDQSGYLLVVPFLIAFFFDFLINWHSFSIKRMGNYLSKNIESHFKTQYGVMLWETHLRPTKGEKNHTKTDIARFGNIGLTFLSLICAISGIIKFYSSSNLEFFNFEWLLIGIVSFLFLVDCRLYWHKPKDFMPEENRSPSDEKEKNPVGNELEKTPLPSIG